VLLGVEAAAIMLSVPMFLLAFHAPLPAVVLGCVVFGIGAAMLSVLTMTAIQRVISRSMLSRTMAMVQLANTGLNPAGFLIAGLVMSAIGAPASLGLSGLCIIATAAFLLSQPEIRLFECRLQG